MTADPPVRLSAETLAPCPFCGARLIRSEAFSTRSTDYFVHPQADEYCPANDVRLTSREPHRTAAWNRRSPCPEGVTEEALSLGAAATIERLTAALREIDAVLTDEITARFGGDSQKSEEKVAGSSRVYALLVVPRNMARAALSQRPAAVGGGEEDCSPLPPTPMPIGGE